MTTAETIFDHRERWQGPVVVSVAAHVALVVVALVLSAYAGRRGAGWGENLSSDGAMSATLVSSAIPLPTREVETENVLANESAGLAESVQAKPEPVPEAIPIPEKTSPAKAKKAAPKTKAPPKPQEAKLATNVVPFGQGGPVAGNYTVMKTDTGSGGLSLGPSGSFGSRYAWYVETVRRKISENWLKYEIDPRITSAQRVYITFEIERSGQPSNVRISQTSGVPSLDNSARRALERIDTFGPLPRDYQGGRVMVEFWFDYQR